MKTRRYQRRHGALILEALTALTILATTAIPVSLAVQLEQRKLRRAAERAVLMELIDGELEVLHAGWYRQFEPGVPVPYPVRGQAAERLPPGEFRLTVSAELLVLEWTADDGRRHYRGSVANPETTGGPP